MTVGGFVPIFSVRLASAEFPATSVAVPEPVWPAPSVLIVWGGGQAAIGAVVFVQTKLTVTLELFHPYASGTGDAGAVILGGVNAIFSSTFAVAEFPATSATVPVTIWFAPSVLTVWGCGQLAIGAVVAVQLNVTVTAELFQPLAFA